MRGLLVLWDVDFTLIGASGVGQRLYGMVFRDMFGRELPGTAPMAGRTDRAIILDTLTRAGVDEPRAQVDQFIARLAAMAPAGREVAAGQSRALPGAAAALTALARYAPREAFRPGASVPGDASGDGDTAADRDTPADRDAPADRGAPADRDAPADGGALADGDATTPEPGRLWVVQSVLTGNVRQIAEVKLSAAGLAGHLDLGVGAYGESHEVRAELVHLARASAARRYGAGFAGEQTVLVGDTELDVAAALATGARVVGVATGGTTADKLAAAGAHAVLTDLADTAATLAAILGGSPQPAGLDTKDSPDDPTALAGLPGIEPGHSRVNARQPLLLPGAADIKALRIHSNGVFAPRSTGRPGPAAPRAFHGKGPVVTLHLPSPCQDLLELQHGVIARWQAAEARLDTQTIDAQLRQGHWRPLYRGVYATFTGEPPRLPVLWAAVLRAGPGALLSHRSAAELDGLLDQPAPACHVMISSTRRITASPGGRTEQAPRIAVHYSARIGQSRHPTRLPPRTRIEETTLDLSQAAVTLDDALSWLVRACSRRLTKAELLLAAMEARPKLRWRTELANAVGDVGDGAHSILEWRYIRGVERPHGLPRATRQAMSKAGRRTRYLDNRYQEFAVAVELDGQAAHPAEARWRDIRRDNTSAAVGIVTLRYGWADVTESPCRVAAEVAQVLRLHGWTGSLRACGPHCVASS